MTKSRALVGAGVIAIAVSIPDISAGAMDAPLMRFEIGEAKTNLPPPIWSPSAGATAPVYAPAMAAEEIAPASITFGSRSLRLAAFDQVLSLSFLEAGSERFDLAFAGVVMPNPAGPILVGPNPVRTSLAGTAIAPRLPAPSLPNQPLAAFSVAEAPLRARLIDVPQINASRVRGLQSAFDGTVAAPSAPTGSARALGNDSVAMANEAVEAAFAGELDVSGGASETLRRALPVNIPAEVRANLPAEVEAALAMSIPAPDSGLAASRAAQTDLADLVQKTELGARVNGVLTGAVDFQQRDGAIAVRLGSVVDLLRDRYSSSEIDRIAGSGALGSYVTLAQLQAAGVPISYNSAYDEVEFGIDYDDAPEAAKVQVEQIGAPTMGTDRVGIDQIPR